MTTHLIVSFVVKPERVADFKALLMEVKVSLPIVAGVEAVSIFQDAEQLTHFTIVEAWSSPAQHRAHIENMQRAGSWDKLVSHLAADPVHGYFREL